MRLFILIISLTTNSILAQKVKTAKTFYTNKVLKSEHLYQDGNKKSYQKNYYENGKIKSEGWLYNNLKNGFWRFYKNNQLVLEGKYLNNKKKGTWKIYDETGKIKQIAQYGK